ncbi:hypothetical protein [Ralstonia sp. ASV6]|uniref:hypothetical protein n=1 Tax=Ralstonia sp. ASV6 TaxID=2795124 RepID=UPI0018EB40C0|nr:hypothetical protein [Ralstonia sp. ASV6]
MANVAENIKFQNAAGGVNFDGLLAGVRALKPKCAECGIPLQESITGVRFRETDEGTTEKLCRACAVTEIGEELVTTLPR